MFRSLRSRLLAMLTGVVVVTVVTIGVVAGATVRESSTQQIRGELSDQAEKFIGLTDDGAVERANQLKYLTHSRVFTLKGERVGSLPQIDARATDADPGGRGGSRPARISFDSGGRRWDGSLVRGEDTWFVVARRHADISGGWRSLAFQIAVVLITGLLVAWIVGIAVSYRITRPLSQLVRAANDIAKGRYPDTALHGISTTDDEIGLLSTAFRDMAMKLREVDSHDRRFLMSISHELRTPLTAITGHAQALEDGLAEDPEVRMRSLAVIRREAGRLDRLVEDIIDLARLRSNRFNTVTETVHLEELGEHIMAIFEDRSAFPDVQVRGDFEHVRFYSDGQRILQILRNLINNGLRYATTEVTVTGEQISSRVRLTVANDGEAIPDDMHEKLFEAFVGTKREGGMGLGLAIGRELAWALGGNLRIVPSVTGAIFELTLPLEPPGSGR